MWKQFKGTRISEAWDVEVEVTFAVIVEVIILTSPEIISTWTSKMISGRIKEIIFKEIIRSH